MKDFFTQIFQNRVLITTLLAWIIAQTLKVIFGVIIKRKFDFRWFVGTGGMPSSHVSGATALAASVGIECGFNSVYFALAAAFALVVIFDAQGVRRAAGKQAHILNKIMDDIYWQGRIGEERLRELIGHTPLEVFGGILIGIAVVLWRHWGV
jgi:acid phosphatase family membrane protein YuiD